MAASSNIHLVCSSNVETSWALANWAMSSRLLDLALLIAVHPEIWDSSGTNLIYLSRVSVKSVHRTVNHIPNCCSYRIEKLWSMNGNTGVEYHRNRSVSGMFVFNGLPIFMDMWHRYIYGCAHRLTNSDNAIVSATVSSRTITSNVWKCWDCILYTSSDSY